MIQEFEYRKENYKIIEGINIQKINFVIIKNKNNIISYMKLTELYDRTVFTPLDKLIEVFKDYNNQKIFNIKKILDYFTNKLNISIKKNRLKIYDANLIINEFTKFIRNNSIIIDNNNSINNKELKKIDKFLSKFETKPLLLKFCNIYSLILLLTIIGITFFSKNLINWYSEGHETKEIATDIITDTPVKEEEAFSNEEITEILENTVEESNDIDKYSYNYWAYSNTTIMSVDFSELLQVNPDTVGWIYVNNTNINYPIVQSGDNSYYLDHSFKKNYNKAGWIFADFRSNLTDLEKNTVLYGHGRYDRTMFGSLLDILNNNWYSNPENQVIKLSTPTKNMLWQIISIYTIPSESYYLTHTFENDESYSNFLNTIVGRSNYNFNVAVDTNDHILTLSTCLDNNGNRIVVHAKLIKSVDR